MEQKKRVVVSTGDNFEKDRAVKPVEGTEAGSGERGEHIWGIYCVVTTRL